MERVILNRVVHKVGTKKGRLLSTSCRQSKALDKGKAATKDSFQCLPCSNTLRILQGGDRGCQAQCWTSLLPEEPTPLLSWAVTEKLKAFVVLWGKWMTWHWSSHQLIPVVPAWPWREGWFYSLGYKRSSGGQERPFSHQVKPPEPFLSLGGWVEKGKHHFRESGKIWITCHSVFILIVSKWPSSTSEGKWFNPFSSQSIISCPGAKWSPSDPRKQAHFQNVKVSFLLLGRSDPHCI